MIPQTALDAWRQHAPWPNEIDVEQDLVLSRLIIEFAQHPLLAEQLAFRGGTCLHKLHAGESPRYSNDLDYVRTTVGPIQRIMASVRDVATEIGLQDSGYSQKHDAVNMRFAQSATGGVGLIRVKVEINTRETEPFRDHARKPMRVDNPWFIGEADVLTFQIEEILGTKMRALYQRRKGRDLFDLWYGLEHLHADPGDIVNALQHYLERGGLQISRAEFERNLDAKLGHSGFRADLDPLLIEPPSGYDLDEAAELVRARLIQLLD